MYKSDVEMFYRMAVSRLKQSYAEIERISVDIFNDDSTMDAMDSLSEAIELFEGARINAADHFGFEIKESMKT